MRRDAPIYFISQFNLNIFWGGIIVLPGNMLNILALVQAAMGESARDLEN
jgi:hypothetical protein